MPDRDPGVTTLCDGDPLARSLAALRPAPAGLDPTRVVFLAGQDAAARRMTFWRRVAVAQGAAVVALGCLAAYQSARVGVSGEQVTARPSQVPPPPAGPEAAPRPREPLDPSAEPYTPGPVGFMAHANPDEPTPQERAKWLHLRNDVLAGGIGVLPARPPAGPDALDGSIELPRGVYAVPPRPAPPPKTDLPPD